MSLGNSENTDNPYAVYNTHAPAVVASNVGIYQSGNLLVVHKHAELPNVCIKSNQPTTTRLTRKLSWHHPALYLLILLHVLIYVIVALAVRKTATFEVPLAPEYKARRVRWMIIAWSLFLLSLVLFVVGAVTIDNSQGPMAVISAICLIQFPFSLITAALMGVFGCRVVYAKKIDQDYVWMAGVCEQFRSAYPIWPRP